MGAIAESIYLMSDKSKLNQILENDAENNCSSSFHNYVEED